VAASSAQSAVAPASPVAGYGFVDAQNFTDQSRERQSGIADWIENGDVAVEIRSPFKDGPTVRSDRLGLSYLPEWVSPPMPGIEPKRAVALRFKRQIESTLELSDPPAYIEPSGVSNSVLTSTLRDFVTKDGERVEAPVRYQDGSEAAAFPLRCLKLSDTINLEYRQLRVALISIRHVEMDIEVDGCWFRNAEISRLRPAADTDELAYRRSKEQLEALTKRGPIVLRMYQTGLDAAIVGFYRAVTHQLLMDPASLAVVPLFFRHSQGDGATPQQAHANFGEGTPWAV